MVKKLVLYVLLLVLTMTLWIVLFGTTQVNGESYNSRVHVLVNCEDQDTELEISVDGKWRGQDILDNGLTVYTFRTKESCPEVRILAYGDTIVPKLCQGRSGDWYTIVNIAPPKDGDGGNL